MNYPEEEQRVVDMIQQNAEFVQHDLDAGYDGAGIESVDEYIGRMRILNNEAHAQSEQVILDTLASFVGEVIVKTCGGKWVFDKVPFPYVLTDDEQEVHPFDLVRTRFSNEQGESLGSMYQTVVEKCSN